MRKLLLSTLLLILPMLASAYDIVVNYDEGVTILYNYINDGTELEVKMAYHSGDLNIPAEVTYEGKTLPVTSIGESAFFWSTSLTSVTIPNSVTTIGASAFSRCTGLTSVTIPNSVTTIESEAFSYCTGLTSAPIPNSVTTIGASAFYGCTGLTSLIVPKSVTTIGASAFSGCTGLTSVNVESGNTVYDSRNNCNAIIEKATNTLVQGCNKTVIPNGVTTIGNSAFKGCTGLTSVTIPNSVTTIGNSAFYHCTGLTSVDIPNSVTSMGNGVFQNCFHLTSLTIGNSVTSIGDYAFSGCSELTSAPIPNSVTTIGASAFYGCTGLTSMNVESGNTVYDSRDNCNAIIETASNTLILGCLSTVIPDGVTTIGNSAFYACKGLTSVNFPNSVISIGDYAFTGCTGLTSVTIPNSVTAIGYWAFNSCTGLTSLTIGNSVTNIGDCAFTGCDGLTSLNVASGNTVYDSRNNCNAIIEKATNTLILGCKKTVIPYGVTTIGNSAFNGCSGLTSVNFPNSVTSIKDYAFMDCTGLTSVTIGNSVTSIGDHAFTYCTGLTSVTIPNSVTTIGNSAFYGCTGLTSVISKMENPCSIDFFCFSYDVFENATLYVPKETKEEYQSTECWNNFKTIEEGEPTVTSVKAAAERIPVLISSRDGNLLVASEMEGQNVSVYTLDGKALGSAKVKGGQAVIATNLPKGTIVVVKVGERSVKASL